MDSSYPACHRDPIGVAGLPDPVEEHVDQRLHLFLCAVSDVQQSRKATL